jgi:peptidylprolyl isomerase
LEVNVFKISYIVLVVIFMIGVMITGCSAAGAKVGDTVQVHYTLTLADGTVFDSSVGGEPMEFTIGSGQLIAGFDEAVQGMKVGEKKTVTIPADKAYGPYLDTGLVEVPREKLPSDQTPEVGQQLVAVQSDGSQARAIITSISDNVVVVDFNHPLAGKDLTFEIELVKIL